jgi:VCBS repeat-containing protein
MPQFNVSESISSATTQVTGSVGSGITLLGITRAGTSNTGVGQTIEGTYGSLVMNANGSFTYTLDNTDPDTNVLGTGMSALERFTYTYSQNGVVHTAVISFNVNGVDESGQILVESDVQIRGSDFTIPALERIHFTSVWGYLLDDTGVQSLSLVNNGAILSSSTEHESNAIGFWNFTSAPTTLTNNGLIEARGSTPYTGGLGNNSYGPVINNGVIRAIGTGDGTGTLYGQPGGATGLSTYHHGETIINNGTIEALSQFGGAVGINSGSLHTYIENSGLIYVESGAPSGSPDWGVKGISSGQSDDVVIVNSGTIWCNATAGHESIGILLFPDSTNVYQYGTVINTGTIVATTAIEAIQGYSTGIHVTNSGHIEGNLLFDHNMNIVTNQAGGTWIGNLQFGFDSDVVRNAGSITGNVALNAGDDFYDGTGGTVSGTVDASGGRDLLIGGTSVDRLNGGDGDDRIYGGGGADVLTGGLDADVFYYSARTDSVAGAQDTINSFQTAIDKIDLSQLAPSNVLITSSGGYSTITATVAGGTMSIRAQGTVVASDILTTTPLGNQIGTGGSDFLQSFTPGSHLDGGAGTDLLYGSSGADLLDGGLDSDTMYGGAGDDTYVIDADGDRVIELAGGGTDLVQSWIDYSLQAFAENLTLLGSANIGALGNESDNIITGNSGWNELSGDDGNDVLVGGGGADTLNGNAGADVFRYLAASDSVSGSQDYIRYFEHGTDKIDISALNPVSFSFSPFINYWGPSDVTTVTIETATGTMVISVDGNVDESDFIMSVAPVSGSTGNNILMGTSSSDWLEGNAGNDQLIGGNGSDTLRGGTGDDSLYGGAGADVLTGGAGADRFYFNSSPFDPFDRIVDFGPGDKIYLESSAFGGLTPGALGDAFHQGPIAETPEQRIIYDSNAGTVYFDPDGSGPEAMVPFLTVGLFGGFSTKSFTADDFVVYVQQAVQSAVTYTLAPGEWNLSLTGASAIDGKGNVVDNVITGNDANNKIYGYDGNDTLTGAGGDDYLFGAGGNDTLTAGAGYDRMYGGAGDDTYYASDATDFAYENVGEGHDRVFASVDYQLRDYVEDLTLSGTAAIGKGNASDNSIVGDDVGNKLYGYGGNDALVGNAGDDYLFGADGNDTLNGGAGYDRMYGGTGNDTYYVNDSTDNVYENPAEGNDRVISSLVSYQLKANVEELDLAYGVAIRGYGQDSDNVIVGNASDNYLYGRGGNDTIFGDWGADILYGEDGNDTLDGGVGMDRFYGGAGADTFVFKIGDFVGSSSATADRIHDFSHAEGDRIDLSQFDASIYDYGDQAFTFIGTNAFSGALGELRYVQISGQTYVQGDYSGDGIPDFWLRIDGLHTLTAADFIL